MRTSTVQSNGFQGGIPWNPVESRGIPWNPWSPSVAKKITWWCWDISKYTGTCHNYADMYTHIYIITDIYIYIYVHRIQYKISVLVNSCNLFSLTIAVMIHLHTHMHIYIYSVYTWPCSQGPSTPYPRYAHPWKDQLAGCAVLELEGWDIRVGLSGGLCDLARGAMGKSIRKKSGTKN